MTSKELLPSSASQFSKQSYWERFFGKRGAAAFEWYGEWKDLHDHITPHLTASSRVLVIGCGNSDFSEQMWTNGYRHLLSIDYSETVIKQMQAKNQARHGCQPEGLEYKQMDLHDIKADAESFDVIMDKACLDALVTDPSLAVFQDVSSMIDETIRVLTKTQGTYICVTLAQTHVLKFLLTKFAVGWEGVVTQAVSVEAQASLSSFIFAFTRGTPGVPTTLKIDLDETDSMFGVDGRKQGVSRDVAYVELGLEEPRRRSRPAAFQFGGMRARAAQSTSKEESEPNVGTVRLAAFEKVAARLDGARKMLYAQKELKQLQFSGGIRHSAQILAAGRSSAATGGSRGRIPRYEISVVDRVGGPAKGSPSVAVLLVHPSRFQDFEFAKEEGQQQVTDSTGYGRLVFVRLHPAHEFNLENGMAAVQAELSSLVKPLFPSISDKKREQVPYLAIGEDEDPSRVRICQLTSEASGDIIIEECDDPTSEEDPPQRLRQLIFLAQLGTVQTEMRLLKGSQSSTRTESGRQLEDVDHSYLGFELHRVMIAGLCLAAPALARDASNTSPRNVTVLGLGGGSLVMFLRKHFNAHVKVVELDATVVKTARDYFGFVKTADEDTDIELFIEDGLEFVKKEAASTVESGPGTGAGSQHVVFVDVDAKDNTTGIMFPPPAFLSRDFLETLYNVLHGDGGLLVLNFACRSPSLYEATIGRIKDVFDAVFEVLVSKEDCNVVVFAIRSDQLPEGAEATIPTSVAGAEHFLAHRSGNDATSTIAASSPLLRSLSTSAWAPDLRFGDYVSRIQTQVGAAYGLVSHDMRSDGDSETASSSNAAGRGPRKHKKGAGKNSKKKGKKKKKKK